MPRSARDHAGHGSRRSQGPKRHLRMRETRVNVLISCSRYSIITLFTSPFDQRICTEPCTGKGASAKLRALSRLTVPAL